MTHRNCLPPGTPADGMLSDARGDRRLERVDFACECGKSWKVDGLGWVRESAPKTVRL